MNTILEALKNYAANHSGAYPENLDELIASGDLQTTNLTAQFRPDDFEILTNGFADPQGGKFIVGIRSPLPRSGGASVMILGGISDQGVPHTEIMNAN